MKRQIYNFVSSLIFLSLFISAANVAAEDADFFEMGLEELMEINVSSVSKKDEKLSETAAAVFVLTKEDIRRSGVVNIPDLLRLIPGVHVGQIDAAHWAVTARGENGLFSNKLLVMVDGRTVYTHLFGGVFWEEFDFAIEDIKRIEFIRGPGGAIWGANAVNGVMNIITEEAKNSQGTHIRAGGGSENLAFGAVRQGVKLNDKTHLRLSAKGKNIDDSKSASALKSDDAWSLGSAFFRLDHEASDSKHLMVDGHLHHGKGNLQVLMPDRHSGGDSFDGATRFVGGHLMARWEETLSSEQDYHLQFFYDRTDRDEVITKYTVDTFDFDFQHRFQIFSWSEMVWGLGYRYVQDDFSRITAVHFHPDEDSFDLLSGFIHNEVELLDDLKIILGSKIEHNDFTGFEVQPSARFMYTPVKEHSFWGAYSYSVKTPERSTDGVTLPVSAFTSPEGVSGLAIIRGNHDIKSERTNTFELGYKATLSNDLSFDLATFYGHYSDLDGLVQGAPELTDVHGQPIIIAPLDFYNNNSADFYGAELVINWQALAKLRLQATYSYLGGDYHTDELNPDPTYIGSEQTFPHNMATLRSLLDLPYSLELDTTLRYVDAAVDRNAEAYLDMDLRIAWGFAEGAELSIIGRNLLQSSRQEYISDFITIPETKIERQVYAMLTLDL